VDRHVRIASGGSRVWWKRVEKIEDLCEGDSSKLAAIDASDPSRLELVSLMPIVLLPSRSSWCEGPTGARHSAYWCQALRFASPFLVSGTS
jgi:hypothetical protein